jgi:hypothetical protein
MTECGVETLKDGTEICSLHKEPLFDATAFDEVKNGVYLEMKNTFFCPVGRKELTTPFTWGKSRRAQCKN